MSESLALQETVATLPIRILMVEDDSEYAHLRKKILNIQKNPRFEVVATRSLQEALETLAQHPFDVILMDLGLPDCQGLDSFMRIHALVPEIPTLILSGVDDHSFALEAVRLGAQDYLVKGRVDSVFLVRTILYAIERQEIRGQLRSLTHELLATNERLERLALLDPLTELLNRRGLQQVLSREIRIGRREQYDPPLVLLLDLDNFKHINDTWGHGVGDIALKEIAAKIRGSLRASDYIARIGGDEFMILLPKTKPVEGVRVAEKIRLAISEKPVLLSSGKPVALTASLGLAVVSPDTPSIDELLSKTLGMLHESKKEGKNRVSHSFCLVTYQGNDGNGRQDRATSEDHDLARVLSDLASGQSLITLRQPIMRLHDAKVVAYEFLSRSSILVFENPDHFFRVCSEHNILTLVDHHCLKNCIRAGGGLPPSIRRHLNLFPSTMIDIPVHHLLESFPQESAQGSFCIEISEQQIIGDPSYLIPSVHQLKKAGIQIAIDDVGFGRTCLESLVLLEPDIVKIDKRCVLGISENSHQAASFKRLLSVAKGLGSEVIAEGIESLEDLNTLRSFGVEYGQGFFFGKPALN